MNFKTVSLLQSNTKWRAKQNQNAADLPGRSGYMPVLLRYILAGNVVAQNMRRSIAEMRCFSLCPEQDSNLHSLAATSP